MNFAVLIMYNSIIKQRTKNLNNDIKNSTHFGAKFPSMVRSNPILQYFIVRASHYGTVGVKASLIY